MSDDYKKYIVGLDLGDGESCLSFVDVESNEDPNIFYYQNNKGTIPTAYAEVEDEVYLGERALWWPNAHDFFLSFKTDPSTDSRQWSRTSDKLKRFFEEFLFAFYDHHPEIMNNHEIYIGCPTGWDNLSQIKYKEVLLKSEVPLSEDVLHIVPESRSAMIQARDKWEIKDELINESILVIDIGSSTIDFSLLNGLEEPQDLKIGADIGLRLVDKCIYDRLILFHPEFQDYKRHPVLQKYLIFLCRLAKEAAFGGSVVLPDEIDLPNIQQIWAHLQNMSLERVLDGNDFWQGETWLKVYKNILHDVRERHLKKDPRGLVIIGGGSNIRQLVEETHEIFPNAECINPVHMSHEAHLAVANGLARYGRWRWRCDRFYAEALSTIKQIPLESKLSEEIGILKSITKNEILKNGGEYFDYLLSLWRNQKIDMVNLDDTIRSISGYTSEYIRKRIDVVIKKQNRTAIVQLCDKANNVVQDEARMVGKRYDIPVTSIQLNPENILSNVETKFLEFEVPIPKDWQDKLIHKMLNLATKLSGSPSEKSRKSGPVSWLAEAVVAYGKLNIAIARVMESVAENFGTSMFEDEFANASAPMVETIIINIQDSVETSLRKQLSSVEKYLLEPHRHRT